MVTRCYDFQFLVMTSIPGTKGTGPAPGSKSRACVPLSFSGSCLCIGRPFLPLLAHRPALLSGISAGLACSAPSAGSPSASVSPLSFAGSGFAGAASGFAGSAAGVPVFCWLAGCSLRSGALFSPRVDQRGWVVRQKASAHPNQE